MSLIRGLKNRMICDIVRDEMIADNSLLAHKQYACNLPADQKRNLVKRMCDMAISMGAEPIRPINI